MVQLQGLKSNSHLSVTFVLFCPIMTIIGFGGFSINNTVLLLLPSPLPDVGGATVVFPDGTVVEAAVVLGASDVVLLFALTPNPAIIYRGIYYQ